MRWLHRLAAVFRKRPLDDDLSEELQSHLAMLTDDNVAAGMAPREAHRQARIAMGNLGVATELHREARGLPTIESVVQDVRYAFRTLARDRGFTTVAVLILGLGIASNAVVYSLVDAILLRSLPFTQADRLVWIANGVPGETDPSSRTSRVLTFRGWRESSRTIDEFAAYSPFFTRASWALTGDDREPERLKGVRVTDNLLPMLGVPMHLGRSFTSQEVADGGPVAVVISYRLWQRSFEADPQIVGKQIELNDSPRTVVGVTGPDFDFGAVFEPGYEIDLLIPAVLDAMANWGNTLAVIGRMAPSATLPEAQEELQTLTARLYEERPELEGWTVEAQLTGLQQQVSAPVRSALWLLWAAVGVVLLIVCANLSNLMLVRGVARRREMAVRAALGASRTRLVRQLLTESLVLASAGLGLGLALAHVAMRVIANSQHVVLPMLGRASINGTVVLVAALAAVTVTLTIGALPALQVSRRDPLSCLGNSARGVIGDRLQQWTRTSLVVAEIALACTLLVGAGLLIRSFAGLLDVNLGFNPDGRASFSVNAGARYEDQPEVGQFQRLLLDSLRQVPGVEGAALTDNLPLDGNRSWGVRRAGDADETRPMETVFVRLVSDGYFETMGVPVVAGRGFQRVDERGGELVVVLNESAASMLWPDREALGESVALGAGDARVVGIVGDVRHNGLAEASGSEMYLALTQYWARSTSLVVHTTGDPQALLGPIRRAVREIDPRVPLSDFRPLTYLVDRAVSARRFVMAMLVGFAGMALVLASLGIYGVISYSVDQRRGEIGIRLALGALPGRVLVEEIRRGLVMTLAGLAIGLAGAFFTTRVVAAQLYGVASTDPATYVVMAAILLTVALVAGYLPARRAARTNPVTALREG